MGNDLSQDFTQESKRGGFGAEKDNRSCSVAGHDNVSMKELAEESRASPTGIGLDYSHLSGNSTAFEPTEISSANNYKAPNVDEKDFLIVKEVLDEIVESISSVTRICNSALNKQTELKLVTIDDLIIQEIIQYITNTVALRVNSIKHEDKAENESLSLSNQACHRNSAQYSTEEQQPVCRSNIKLDRFVDSDVISLLDDMLDSLELSDCSNSVVTETTFDPDNLCVEHECVCLMSEKKSDRLADNLNSAVDMSSNFESVREADDMVDTARNKDVAASLTDLIDSVINNLQNVDVDSTDTFENFKELDSNNKAPLNETVNASDICGHSSIHHNIEDNVCSQQTEISDAVEMTLNFILSKICEPRKCGLSSEVDDEIATSNPPNSDIDFSKRVKTSSDDAAPLVMESFQSSSDHSDFLCDDKLRDDSDENLLGSDTHITHSSVDEHAVKVVIDHSTEMGIKNNQFYEEVRSRSSETEVDESNKLNIEESANDQSDKDEKIQDNFRLNLQNSSLPSKTYNMDDVHEAVDVSAIGNPSAGFCSGPVLTVTCSVQDTDGIINRDELGNTTQAVISDSFHLQKINVEKDMLSDVEQIDLAAAGKGQIDKSNKDLIDWFSSSESVKIPLVEENISHHDPIPDVDGNDRKPNLKDVSTQTDFQEERSEARYLINTGLTDFQYTRDSRLALKGDLLLKRKQEDDKKCFRSQQKLDPTTKKLEASTPGVPSLPSQSSGTDVVNVNNLEGSGANPDLKAAFEELKERYRQAMVYSAQLENERSQLQYHCQMFKDMLEEQEDDLYRVNSEHRSTCQELERQKRSLDALEKKCHILHQALRERDQFIREKGLRGVEETDEVVVDEETPPTHEEVDGIQAGGDDASDSRMKLLIEEKQELIDKVQRLEQELDEERRKETVNGQNIAHIGEVPDMQLLEIQREANRQVSEYKLKLQNSEQDISALRDHISRLESHLHRLKQSTEVFEKNEDEMRAEKRRLARDLRAALDRIEELQMSNFHLEKRLERIRATRAAMSMT